MVYTVDAMWSRPMRIAPLNNLLGVASGSRSSEFATLQTPG